MNYRSRAGGGRGFLQFSLFSLLHLSLIILALILLLIFFHDFLILFFIIIIMIFNNWLAFQCFLSSPLSAKLLLTYTVFSP